MNASIITIGDELLIGQVINTNAAWLSTELTAIGFSVIEHISIADEPKAIIGTLDRCLPASDLLIFTGGLGPTTDDITKKVLAEYFGTRLVFSEAVLQHVEEMIRKAGFSMNENNRSQAMVPEGAGILPNNHGTASGMVFEQGEKLVISLPGVPRETIGIYNDYIKTLLKKHFTLPNIIYKTVMLTGIAEARLAEKLTGWEKSLPENISLAYLPSPGQIRLRLGICDDDGKSAAAQLNHHLNSLHEVVSKYIYGYDDEPLASAVGRMISERKASLVTAESCTGGKIASLITSNPGCSAWYKGGTVAYSNEVKTAVLGVNPDTLQNCGAVSGETVEEMAAGALKTFGGDYAIATSGIAGPDGGTDEKPVGTVWIAAAGPGFMEKRKFTFERNREMNINRSSAAALELLRRSILKYNSR